MKDKGGNTKSGNSTCEGPMVGRSVERVDRIEKTHVGLRHGEKVQAWDEMKLESSPG